MAKEVLIKSSDLPSVISYTEMHYVGPDVNRMFIYYFHRVNSQCFSYNVMGLLKRKSHSVRFPISNLLAQVFVQGRKQHSNKYLLLDLLVFCRFSSGTLVTRINHRNRVTFSEIKRFSISGLEGSSHVGKTMAFTCSSTVLCQW